MTLILTTIRPSEVLITSDGRSVTTQAGKVTAVKDDVQKIFPVPDHPVAIAHHGENIVDDKPVGEFIAKFISQRNVGNMSILELADELWHAAHSSVRKRLFDVRGESGFGLLIAGFSSHQKGPFGQRGHRGCPGISRGAAPHAFCPRHSAPHSWSLAERRTLAVNPFRLVDASL